MRSTSLVESRTWPCHNRLVPHLLGVRLEVITSQFQGFTKWPIVQQPPNVVRQWLQLLKFCSCAILKCSGYIWIILDYFLKGRFGLWWWRECWGDCGWVHANEHSYSVCIGPVTTVQWCTCWDKEIPWASARAWKSVQSSWLGQVLF